MQKYYQDFMSKYVDTMDNWIQQIGENELNKRIQSWKDATWADCPGVYPRALYEVIPGIATGLGKHCYDENGLKLIWKEK